MLVPSMMTFAKDNPSPVSASTTLPEIVPVSLKWIDALEKNPNVRARMMIISQWVIMVLLGSYS